MIEYLRGDIVDLTPTSVVVECNGVGYLAHITLSTYAALQGKSQGKVYLYEAIREDAYVLYGFVHPSERETFVQLLSVSGVGANTARMILSALSPAELHQAIVGGNANLLKSVKGIGGKTAERIIVDLKDKIKVTDSTLRFQQPLSSEVAEEAMSALMMLGFNKAASQKVLSTLLKDDPTAQVEQLIKAALKML